MMRTRQKILSLLTSAALLATTLFLTAASAAPSEGTPESRQTESNIAYNEMLNSFSETRLGRSLVTLEDLNNEAVYPDFYAGAYLNGNGELVVLLTEDTNAARASIRSAAKKSDVLFASAQYAYADLTASMNCINEKVKNRANEHAIASEIVSAGLSDQENTVTVWIKDIDDAKIAQFRQYICDEPWIVFANSTGPATPDAGTLYAGQGIEVVGVSSYSFGYRCKRNGVNGFLTAAHGLSVGKTVRSGATEIGKVTARKLSGSVDVSFVEITNSSYTLSNVVCYTKGAKTLRSGSLMIAAVGSRVNMSGGVTQTTSGIVKQVNYSDTISNVYLTNMSTADYGRAKGDSGAVVYSNDASPYICGVHSSVNTNTGYAIFIKATAIRDQFGVTAY